MSNDISQAAQDILAERQRQISAEGWAPEHDDEHSGGEMAVAAASYAMPIAANTDYNDHPPFYWPWDLAWWKPGSYRRNLVKAGALILAEIERLDRAAFIGSAKPEKDELIENTAKAIYDDWNDQPGWLPWVEGGNSEKQSEARRLARKAIEGGAA